jgi:exonuclease III
MQSVLFTHHLLLYSLCHHYSLSSTAMFDTLKLCTWNTTGLTKRAKRNVVLREVLSFDADIIFLQEIRAKSSECENSDGWLGEEFTPIWDAYLTRHCAILIRKDIFDKAKVVLPEDRCLMLEATCKYHLPSESNEQASRLMYLTCVYAPSQTIERKVFLKDPIWRVIPDLSEANQDLATERFDIVAGDFNDFPHPRDITPSNLPSFLANRWWTRYIGPLLSVKGIVDPLRESVSTLIDGSIEEDEWASLMEEPPFYTRRRANPPTESRIDHILLSRTFGKLFSYSTDSYYSRPGSTISDHFPLFLHLKSPSSNNATALVAPSKQKKWTLHPYWLHESQVDFRERLESYIIQQSQKWRVKERLRELQTATAHERWSTYKIELLNYIKWLTRTLPRAVVPGSDIGQQWKEAEAALESLVQQGKLGTIEYMQLRNTVREIHDLVLSEERCKIKDRENSLQQIPSKVICQAHAQKSNRKQITSLRDVNGIAQHDQKEMLLIARDYYTILYDTPRVDFHALQELMLGGRERILSKSQCRQVIRDFTSDELLFAARKLNDKSMPGEDGLPTAFWTSFPKALDELTEYCNRVLTCPDEFFVPNTPQLHVSLLPKKNDVSELKNRRPIALINTCDRIASAAIATRFNATKIAHTILPHNQTAYVKGRLIFDSILSIQLFISASLFGLTRQDQVIVFLDQEKAFDRLAQKVIIKSLKSYGMPKQILKWFEKLWNGAEARYKINGHLSDRVPIKRGVLQGNPDSALVYCMGSNITLDYLSRYHVAFAYYSLFEQDLKREVDTPAYADDWAVVLSESTVVDFFRCMHLAERSAGTKINEDKTSFLFLPTQGIPEDERWTPALPFAQIDPSTDYRYLGGFIRGDGQPATESHLKLIHDSRRGMLKWQSMTLAWYGRVKLVNTFYLSKLWHALGSAGGIDEGTILKALQKNLIEIIFGTKQALIRLSTLAMPYKDGGLNLLLPTHMLTAMAGRDLIRSLSWKTHSCELFRECLEAQSRTIGLNSTAWLERNHRA